jgi:hypothetical protein
MFLSFLEFPTQDRDRFSPEMHPPSAQASRDDPTARRGLIGKEVRLPEGSAYERTQTAMRCAREVSAST